MLVSGLSPRVRGNRRVVNPLHAHAGSIPACAGEPPKSAEPHSRGEVYPRVCGGTRRRFPAPVALAGLSPRVRGNHTSVTQATGAYAVYPRVCGGTLRTAAPTYTVPGLSPRVRGNRARWTAPRPPPGSIPACAGEPALTRLRITPARVYPRVCGGTRRPGKPA